ncbi:gp16 family protein [Lonepinella sp. BR2271]|uniref:gp16 family protein n=1 Tax=Lonepinella sp. BR2271 TaxID=3434550 RepID=UPI003F6DF712
MQYTKAKLIQLIHIGKQQLGMDEVSYRALLVQMTGKDSCKLLGLAELEAVFGMMKQKGFKPTTTKFKGQKRAIPRADKQKYLAKITALLANLGLPVQYADSMAKKAFNVDFVHWLEPWQLHKVVQMLAVYEYRKQGAGVREQGFG